MPETCVLLSMRLTAIYALRFFFLKASPTSQIFTLSLHDALPISSTSPSASTVNVPTTADLKVATVCAGTALGVTRSEEHTSELQSHHDLVCRLLHEQNNRYTTRRSPTYSASAMNSAPPSISSPHA